MTQLHSGPRQPSGPPPRPSSSQPSAGGGHLPGLDDLLGPAAAPPRRRRVRNVLIGSGGALVVLLVGVAIGAAGAGTAKPAPAPTVTVTAAAAPAPTVTVTETTRPAAIARPTVTVTAPAPAATASSPPSGVLMTFSGSGIRNSASFVVGSSTVTAHYSYDCSAFGGSGNFIADMVSGSPSSLSYDDQSIANALGSGGSQTTTLYPQNQGGSYHLEVNSECSWSITLTAG
jgi:hypothetical protein